MRTKIIYNPKSGKRTLQPQMSYVIEQLSAAGYNNVEVYPTKAVGDAAEAARNACAKGCDLVIAVGGDGTVSEVVNGLVSFAKTCKEKTQEQTKIPVLGCIPSGTSNDFASALRIPNDLRKAVRIITKGHCAQVDIGSINNQRSFTYIVAAGAFTRLTYTTPQRLKHLLGTWAYLKDIFRELPLIKKPFRLRLTVDGKKISGEYVIALVINSPNFAGMRKVVPKACMDDGILDILLLPKSNPKVFFTAIRCMAMGVDENIADSGILHLCGRKISIEAEKRLDWNIDGELGGTGAIDIECLEKYLAMMVPAVSLHKVLFHQDYHLARKEKAPTPLGRVRKVRKKEIVKRSLKKEGLQ